MRRVVGLFLLVCSPVLAQDAMFRGNPLHTGEYPGAGISKFTKVRWQFRTKGQVLSSPAVAGDTVYIGSSDHLMYALDRATGDKKWEFKTESRITSSPAVSGGVVFFGSYDGNSSPAVADGVVYFGCRDSNFYAVDLATGKQRWAYPNKGSWVIASPAISSNNVYFATSDTGQFHAVDAKTGAELFSIDNHHWPMFSSPAVAGGFAFIGSQEGKLLAMDLKTHAAAWTFETEAHKQNAAMYTKEGGLPKYEAAFFDFFYDDMMSGVQKMMSVGAVLSSPVVAGDTIYFGSTDGNVYAFM